MFLACKVSVAAGGEAGERGGGVGGLIGAEPALDCDSSGMATRDGGRGGGHPPTLSRGVELLLD